MNVAKKTQKTKKNKVTPMLASLPLFAGAVPVAPLGEAASVALFTEARASLDNVVKPVECAGTPDNFIFSAEAPAVSVSHSCVSDIAESSSPNDFLPDGALAKKVPHLAGVAASPADTPPFAVATDFAPKQAPQQAGQPFVGQQKVPLDEASAKSHALAEQKLDPQQRQAVIAGPYPLLVRGGPGTGKTTVLAERLLYLLDEGVALESVLVVTPTRRAALELEAILHLRQPEQVVLPIVDTLSSIALGLWHNVHGDLPMLLPLNEDQQLFGDLHATYSLAEREAGWNALESFRKNAHPLPEVFEPWLERYTRHKHAWNLADGPDLIHFWQEQVAINHQARRWEHILLDDAQCFTLQELNLLHTLLPPSGEGFFGLVDISQSSWKRSMHADDPERFFKDAFEGLHTHALLSNYRSVFSVVRVLNAMQDIGPFGAVEPVEPNTTVLSTDKTVLSAVEGGGQLADATRATDAGLHAKERGTGKEPIRVQSSLADEMQRLQHIRSLFPLQAGSGEANLKGLGAAPQFLANLTVTLHEQEEVLWLAEQLDRLLLPASLFKKTEHRLEPCQGVVAATLGRKRYGPKDIAVFVRHRELAEQLQEKLPLYMHAAVTFGTTSSLAFQDDERVALILRLARQLLCLRLEEPRVQVFCPDGVVLKGPLAIAAFFAEIPPFDTAFWQTPVFRTLVKLYDECGGWPGLLTLLALHEKRDFIEKQASVIPVLTYDEAPGKSFPVVFLPGLEDGLVPFAGSLFSGKHSRKTEMDVAGEHRMLLGAVARAKEHVLFSCTRERAVLRNVRLHTCRFIKQLPRGVLTVSALQREASQSAEQLSLLQ